MIGHQYLLMDVVYQRNLEYKGVQVVAHAHYVGNPRRCECGRPVGRGFHGLQVTTLRVPSGPRALRAAHWSTKGGIRL